MYRGHEFPFLSWLRFEVDRRAVTGAPLLFSENSLGALLINALHNGLRNSKRAIAALAASAVLDFQNSRLVLKDSADGVDVELPSLGYLRWCEMTLERRENGRTTGLDPLRVHCYRLLS